MVGVPDGGLSTLVWESMICGGGEWEVVGVILGVVMILVVVIISGVVVEKESEAVVMTLGKVVMVVELFSLDVVRSLSLEYEHVAMNLTLLEQVDTTSIFICTCTKTVSNKVEGRIWLCYLPVFGWSNLRIREDRPVISGGGGGGSVDVVSVVAIKLEGTFSLAMLSAQFYQQR
ncbi:hypothetical protein Tco_0089336 [Tanacetum coccineum]